MKEMEFKASKDMQGEHGALSTPILVRLGWYALDEAPFDPFNVCCVAMGFNVCCVAMGWFEVGAMVDELLMAM